MDTCAIHGGLAHKRSNSLCASMMWSRSFPSVISSASKDSRSEGAERGRGGGGGGDGGGERGGEEGGEGGKGKYSDTSGEHAPNLQLLSF